MLFNNRPDFRTWNKKKKKKKKQQKNFTAVTCEASKDQMSLLYQETALTS